MTGRSRPACVAALALVSAIACGESFAPLSRPASPEQLRVRAVGVAVVRLSWLPSPEAVSYRVERRKNHEGQFLPLDVAVPQAPDLVVFLDTEVEPETYYGYRVVAISRYGDRSAPSVVGGTRTPPPPGIVVVTESQAPVAEAADPDGYRVTIVGPDTTSAILGTSADRRFAPLKPGSYKVILQGVIARCSIVGDSARIVTVPDSGVNTLIPVKYNVSCRDPQRGRIVGIVSASGDSLDANGFQLQLTGVLSDASLPDSLKVVTQRAGVPPAGGTSIFDNLKAGTYELELREVDSHCTRRDNATRTISVAAGSTDTARFVVVCESMRPDNSNRPLVLRNAWSAASAPQGAKVSLLVTLDASARDTLKFANVTGLVRYPGLEMRFDSAQVAPANALDGLTVNGNTSGLVSFVAIDNQGVGRSGVVGVAHLHFTVQSAGPATVATRTSIEEVETGTNRLYQDSTYAIEDTLTIGGGGTAKVPPVANANGPYAGTVGNAISFSSSGSNDPDGGALTYAWDFGDGTTSSQPSPGKTYAAAGTYSVALTVTDDENVSTSAQTTATITASGQPPVTPPANKPIIWKNVWSAGSAALGEKVQLTITLDATARSQLKVGVVDAMVRYNSAALRYDRGDPITTNGLDLTANSPAPGQVAMVGLAPSGLSNVVGVARLEFTVIDTGRISATETVLNEVQDINFNEYKDSTFVVEDTVSTAAGAQPPPTQPPPTASAPLIWRYEFSSIMQPTPDSSIVVMSILYDMRADLPETSGPESLSTWRLDSLTWNTAVLSFVNASWGKGGSGSWSQSSGKLTFLGGLTSGVNSGLLELATVRFRVTGASGQASATRTWVNYLRNSANFNYKPYTTFQEGTFTVP